MDTMLTWVGGFLGLIVFDALALRFGVCSRDGRKEVWW